MTDHYLTAQEIADYLNISKTSLYGLIKSNGFPSPLKLGRSSRWLNSEVQSWIAAQRGTQPAEAR